MNLHTSILTRLSMFLLGGVLLLAGSCINDPDLGDPFTVEEVTLQLTTRADEGGRPYTDPGEDPYNENRLNRAMIFFYAASTDGTKNDDAPAIYRWENNALNATQQTTLRLSAEERVRVFGHNMSARAFAVVNLPDGVKIKEDASVNEILSTVVTANFRYYNASGTTDAERQSQPEFLMLGEGTVTFEDETMKKASGRILLKRTASKIRLALSVDEPVTDSDPSDPDSQEQRWIPQTDAIRVYLTNGVRMAHAGGAQMDRTDLEQAEFPDGGNGYFKISPGGQGEGSDFMTLARTVRSHEKDEMLTGMSEDYPIWHDVPLYSYPHQWENTPQEERQTYLVVQVPFRAEGKIDYQIFYYQVPLNLRGGDVTDDQGDEDPDNDHSWSVEGNTLDANMYYIVKLHVGMLGSFDAGDPVNLEAHYYVVPWQDEPFDARLRDNRYLVLNELEWPMHNQADLDVPFYTSHETVVARVKFHYYNFNPPGDRTSGLKYYDDDEEFVIDYRGKPLRRTFFWYNPELPSSYFTNNNKGYSSAAEANSVYNLSMEQNGDDPIWSTDIDNENLTVSYHHDMKRWTEYVGEVSANTERFVHNSYNIIGFTGIDNGRDVEERAKKNATTWLKKSDENNWSIIQAEITIIHKDLFEQGLLDNTRFQQTIYITQYPSQYIEASYNDGANYPDDGGWDGRTQTNRGANTTVFVNGHQGYEPNAANVWCHTSDITKSMNYNPNMYVITITQLGEEESDLTIGDPRSLSKNNNLSNSSFGGYDIDTDDSLQGQKDDRSNPDVQWGTSSGSQRRLVDTKYWEYRWNAQTQTVESTEYYGNYSWRVDPPVQDAHGNKLSNYYPADEATGAGSKATFVAPKLRVASSYGTVQSIIHRAGARRRCASYQEAGRPAGRWRLPTQAEIQYISNLSAKGRIPELFSKNPGYVRINSDEPETFIFQYNWNGWTGRYENSVELKNVSGAYYWCAQGLAYINGYDGVDFTPKSDDYGKVLIYPETEYTIVNGNSRAATNYVQAAVRCVYDEWYWQKEDGTEDVLEKEQWTSFSWGDKEKFNPQD